MRISEEVKVEQKTKYGVVISKRTAGSVVKVVSLSADSLTIESDELFGKISVEKTDFWDRAEKTMDAANQKDYREKALVRERERKEAEERVRVRRIERYEAATPSSDRDNPSPK